MRIDRTNLLLATVLIVSLTMLIFSFSCTKHHSANPVAPIQDPTVFITSLIADPPLVDAESDTSLITARVVDANGAPISDQVVQFSTNLGHVEEQVVTTSAGYATAVYVSGSLDGIAQVTATVDDVRRSVAVQVGLGTGLLAAQPSDLLADGVSYSVVTARILDENGDPRSDVPVYFYTTCGEITLTATSDGDGLASAILISAVSARDTAAYVSVAVAEARGLVGGDEPTLQTRDRGPTPETDGLAKGLGSAATDEMAKVVFRGISLTLTSEEEALSADGLSSTQLTASMIETSPPHAPVVGLPVTFTSDLGDISPREVTTDADGRAVTALTSGREDGIATVQAEYRSIIVASAPVTFRPLILSLSSDRSSLLANGEATSAVTARLLNSDGNPVSGAEIEFSVDRGSISSPHTTDAAGKAVATLTSGSEPGTCNITAHFGGSVSASLAVEFSSYDIALVADPSSILADGVEGASITVVLRDGEGCPLPEETVALATDLGVIEPQTLVTDAGGSGQAILTSWASAVDTQAVVTATFNGSSNQVSVSQRGVSLSLAPDQASIVANGTSSTLITATLLEAVSGLPLPSRKILFDSNLGSITEEILTNSWGQASAVLISDLSWGTATITARFGNTLEKTTQVEMLPTDVSQVSLEADVVQLLADGEDQTSLTATVTDADGHPIENVAVSFECLSGSITPSAITDELGQAQALYIAPAATEDQSVSIAAKVGSVAGQEQISLKGITFEVQADDAEVLADGISTTMVVAQINETTSGLPLVGRTVNFRCFDDVDGDGVQDGGEVSLGQIEATGETDASGQARVTLTSQASNTDLQATVRGETDAGLMNTSSLSLVGLVLEMSADPSSIVANGVSTCMITVTLRENNRGYGVPGKEVGLATNLGLFAQQTGTTDADGQVAAVLLSSTSAGAAVVTATYGSTLTQSTTVNFTAVEVADILLQPQASSIRGDGVASTSIDVTVVDADGNPIGDLPVTFETPLGFIDSPVITDDQGWAQTVLTSAPTDVDTVIQVTVTAGSVLEAIGVTLRGVSLDLAFQPSSLLADGVSSAIVTALYQEVTSGMPIVGDTIRFLSFEDDDEDGNLDGGEDLLGSIAPEAITDAGGQAQVTFTSSADSAYRVATVRAATGTGISQSASIEVYGVRLEVVAADASIVANGSSTTEIVATLTAQGEGGANGPIESKNIDFQTNLGTLSPESGTTGSLGQVHTTLTSSSYPGTALITASCGPDIARTVTVDYLASLPDSIMLSAEPAVLPADGISTSEITANIIDANNNPVSDGTLVTFETSAGMITEADVTEAGVAHATLTSCTTPGQVSINASVALSDSGSIVSSPLLLTLTSDEAASIVLSAEPDTIRADGSSTTTLTALVLGPYGNPVTVGMQVDFVTSLGAITPYAFTNEEGIAQAVLTSEAHTGMAIVTATATGAEAHTEIHFISGQASNIVLVSVTDDSIGVQGSGDNETSTITFEIRDDTGTPLDLSQQMAVDFEIVGPSGGGEFLEPTSDLSDSYGRVQTTLNSGTMAKTVKVKATIDSLGIVSEAISIAIHGGPPDEAHFSVVPQMLNFAGLVTYGLENQITAFVGDQYGNPVPEGTSIYFSSTGGIIEGSATTNALGQATVTLVSADPVPVSTALDPSTGYASDVSGYCDFTSPKNGDGQAIVFAQTVDRLENPIWTNTSTIFSAHTGIYNVNPTSFAVADGGSQSFSFSVRDFNGNPLAAGTHISVSASAGQLVGDVSVTLPDTQSAGWTSFSFLLMDDEAGDTSPPETCIVTVSVTSSSNGNASTVVIGSVD